MTMRITVKVEDDGRSAEVCEETYEMGVAVPRHENKTRIEPHESKSFYIHASKRLIVTEIV